MDPRLKEEWIKNCGKKEKTLESLHSDHFQSPTMALLCVKLMNVEQHLTDRNEALQFLSC